jgi:hypothetical protein
MSLVITLSNFWLINPNPHNKLSYSHQFMAEITVICICLATSPKKRPKALTLSLSINGGPSVSRTTL